MKMPQELIEQFARGNGAIFVGAGLSIGAGLPGWGQLIERFAKELPDYPKESTYLDVAQYYVNQHGSNRLVNRLREELDTSGIESTVVHDAVANLKISPIFTTNFDNLIEKSLLKASLKFDKVISDIDPNFWTNERTQLVKLHGDLDYPPSIVVTSENYERYLNDRPAFVRLLTIALQTKTTLFLGYSANDIDVRSLLTLIQNEAGEYARNAFSLMFDAHQLVVQDLERRGIKVINFENVSDKDKNQVLAKWLKSLKEEVEKYSSNASRSSRNTKKNLPSEPYKFLNWFGESDISIFHGRDYEIDNLANLISSQKVVILYGESGTGKTSLLKAGTLPRLKNDGCLICYLRPLTDPFNGLAESLKSCLGNAEIDIENIAVFLQNNLPKEKMLIIVIDQFEEFFIRQGTGVRKKFIQILIGLLRDTASNTHLVLSLRSDFLDRLDELEGVMGRDPLRFRMRLHNLGAANASAAISEPARDFKIPLESTLLDKLVSDLEQGGIAPAQLQIVCFVLWQDWIQRAKPLAGLTYARYLELGSTQDILAEYLKNVIRDLDTQNMREELGITLDTEKAQEAAKAILKSMITSERTKIAVNGKEITQGEIAARLKIPPSQVEALLLYLQNRRVIRHLPDTEYYELVHEVMLQQIWEWVTDEEKKLLDVQDLLVRATTDYRKFQTLLSAEYLTLISDNAVDLGLNEDTLELLLRSAIARNYRPEIWVGKMDAGGAVDVLAQLLASEKKTLFPQIAKALGATKSTKAIRFLDELLKEENRDVQRAAADGLVVLSVRGVVPSLYHAAVREKNIYRCAPLLDALEMLHTDEATAMLMLIASQHVDPGVRNRATHAVLRIGDPQGVRLLIQQLNSEDPSVTESAIRAVETILRTTTDDILDLYRNSDISFRIKIIEGLAKVHGEEKLKIIGEALCDEHLNVRKAALKILPEIGGTFNSDMLITALKNGDTEIRRIAIDRLVQLKDGQAVEPLIAALIDDDVEIRKLIINALVRLDDGRAVEPLIATLKDENVEVRRLAISALGHWKDVRSVEPLIIALKDGDVEIRRLAIGALARMKDTQTIKSLIFALKDEDIEIQRMVMNVISLAIEPLITILKDGDVELRKLAIGALGRSTDRQAADLLIAVLKDGDVELRKLAIGALGRLNDSRAVEPLIAALNDGDVEIRQLAKSTLVQFGDARVIELLFTELKDMDIEIRRRAINDLAQLGDAQVVGLLVADMKNDDVEIRRMVVAALSRIRDQGVVEPLLAALNDENVDIRRMAIVALYRIGGVGAVQPLLAALRDEDVDVRRQVANVLAGSKDSRAVEPLIVALKDVDVSVRRCVVGALGELKDIRAVEPLISAFSDNKVEIKCKIIAALVKINSDGALSFVESNLVNENKEIRDVTKKLLK